MNYIEAAEVLKEILRERSDGYDCVCEKVGEIMETLYPNGVTIYNNDGWVSIFLEMMCAMKLSRAASAKSPEGAADSFIDLAGYATIAFSEIEKKVNFFTEQEDNT